MNFDLAPKVQHIYLRGNNDNIYIITPEGRITQNITVDKRTHRRIYAYENLKKIWRLENIQVIGWSQIEICDCSITSDFWNFIPVSPKLERLVISFDLLNVILAPMLRSIQFTDLRRLLIKGSKSRTLMDELSLSNLIESITSAPNLEYVGLHSLTITMVNEKIPIISITKIFESKVQHIDLNSLIFKRKMNDINPKSFINGSLIRLKMSHCPDFIVKFFIASLHQYVKLMHLMFRMNQDINFQNLSGIINYLSNPRCSLKSLGINLRPSKISDKNIINIFESIGSNQSLIAVYLDLGIASMPANSYDPLINNYTLQSLKNNIYESEDSLQSLVKMVNINNVLQEIKINSSKLKNIDLINEINHKLDLNKSLRSSFVPTLKQIATKIHRKAELAIPEKSSVPDEVFDGLFYHREPWYYANVSTVYCSACHGNNINYAHYRIMCIIKK